MRKVTPVQVEAAVKALAKVFGSPQFYSTEKHPPRVWLVWGAGKRGYSPDDNIQFGMQIRAAAIPKVVKMLEQCGIPEEKQ